MWQAQASGGGGATWALEAGPRLHLGVRVWRRVLAVVEAEIALAVARVDGEFGAIALPAARLGLAMDL